MLEHVLVLGGGSAGYLTAITLKIRLPKLRVTVSALQGNRHHRRGRRDDRHHPATPARLPRHPDEGVLREAEPQWKLGIRYLWGPRPFFDYVFGFQIDTKYALLPKTHRLLHRRHAVGLCRRAVGTDEREQDLLSRRRPDGRCSQ